MATVTGVTAEKAKEIEDRLITGAQRQGSNLILQTAGGTVINVANAFIAPYETTPVGGILMTVNSANPATYMGGGTWVRWGKGRVPVSQDETQTEFDTVEEVGGSKTHTLTAGQMPAHNHGGSTNSSTVPHQHTGYTTTDGGHSHSFTQPTRHDNAVGANGAATLANFEFTNQTTGGSGGHGHNIVTDYVNDTTHSHPISSSGNGEAHPIMQPYIVCYMWKRTA